MPESTFDLSALAAGLLAYALAVGTAVVLVFVMYRVNTALTRGIDEQKLLLSGHRSVAICLGAVIVCQAVLLRHAVFPIMAVVRDLFLAPVSWRAALWVFAQSTLFFVVIAGLALASVALGAYLFARMTGDLPEHEEILKDNVAVAIFFACVLFAITALVNEGLEDLSRSLIPYGRTGILRIP
jgi:uncharacterized membrane protein YjfL (UPF0719 family)